MTECPRLKSLMASGRKALLRSRQQLSETKTADLQFSTKQGKKSNKFNSIEELPTITQTSLFNQFREYKA